MGLIKAAQGAVGGVFADQWKEFIYCEAMDMDTLVQKGEKRVGKRSSNTRGSENIISSGSIVAVADGQCMIIVDQGRIAEISAEPGEYIFDTSAEPSIFSGDLSTSIIDSFKTMGSRFTFGGEPGRDQRVYYINTKEIMGNKFGTPSPIPFRVVDERSNIDQDFDVTCFGQYSYKITDPIKFYTNVCSNVENTFDREQIDPELKSEFLTALQPCFSRISSMGIRISALPGHTKEVANIMREELSGDWTEARGIEVMRVGISSVAMTEEDRQMLKTLQRATTLSDPSRAGGFMVGATGTAMNTAAANTSAGPAMAFMGMGMAQNAGSGYGGLFQQASQNQQQSNVRQAPMSQGQTGYTPGQDPSFYQQTPNQSWVCACGASNTTNFCSQCGSQKPEPSDGWTCPTCHQQNSGRFCSGCGAPRPVASRCRCDKCGWEPPNPNDVYRFCPNCGDVIDSHDMT